MGSFTPEDFAHLAKLLREDNSDRYTAALLSNNFNVILGALDKAALGFELPYTNNWRPMESAPRTGAQIIYRYMDGRDVRAGLMEWRFCTDDDGQSCWWDVGIDDEPYKPTGWIPFPGGPAP